MKADWSNPYLREIVLDWFTMSQDEKQWPNIFNRFIFLWISFDAWASNESGKMEHAMIDWVKTDSNMPEIFKQNFKAIEQTVVSLKSMGEIPNHANAAKSRKVNDVNSFSDTIEAVYLIRNNLFHGHKSPDDEKDRKYVSLAHSIVSSLMKPVVEELRNPNQVVSP